ncbi:MAG: transcriptional antiterminator [Deltaproteobacteria bacterium]|nr:transcriptional antiterminator [Deltaproteobacteria bacterium]
MPQELLQPFWYVLHTKSRFENVVNDGLYKKSFEVFNPKIKVKSKRRDRRVMIKVPLFPGYVFVKTDLNHSEYLEILKTAGVVRFIGNTSGPIPVMDEEIDFMQYRGQGRVVVDIEALGQFAAVNVNEEDLEPVPPILL